MKTSTDLIGLSSHYKCEFEIDIHEESGVIGIQWDINVLYEPVENRDIVWKFFSLIEESVERRDYENIFGLTKIMFNGLSQDFLDFSQRFSKVSRFVFEHLEEKHYCDQNYFNFEIDLPRLENDECCVCLENEPDVSFNPCCHLCICRECFQKMEDKDTCPMCRETVFFHNSIINREQSTKLKLENIKEMRKLFLQENSERHKIEYQAFYQAKHSYHFIICFRDEELKDRFFSDSEITESHELEKLLIDAIYQSI